MSSVLSGFRGRSDLPIPNGAVVLTYGSDDNVVPFTYNNGVLDMDFSSGFSSSTSITSDAVYLRYSEGALHLVTAIGPNFIVWMEDEGGADAGSVSIYENAIVIRANNIQIGEDPDSSSAYRTSPDPWNFTQAAGTIENNNYYSTYLFQKALVLKYTTGGGANTEYAYFNSQLGEKNT
jgi:hypothetical protein